MTVGTRHPLLSRHSVAMNLLLPSGAKGDKSTLWCPRARAAQMPINVLAQHLPGTVRALVPLIRGVTLYGL
jgi:hypothetical protein